MNKKPVILTAVIMAGFLGTGAFFKCEERNANKKVALSEQKMQDSIYKSIYSKVFSLADADHDGFLNDREQTELWFRMGKNYCPDTYSTQVFLDYALTSTDCLRKALESYTYNPESICNQILSLRDKNNNHKIDPEEKPYVDSLLNYY